MQVLDRLKSAHASLQDFYHAVKHKQQTSKAIEALQRLSMVNADVPQMDVLQWMSLMAGAGEYYVKPEDKELHSLFCQVGTRLFTDTVKSPTPLQKHFFWAVVGRWADMVLWSHPIGKQLIREQLEDMLLDYRESGYAVPADYVPGAADC